MKSFYTYFQLKIEISGINMGKRDKGKTNGKCKYVDETVRCRSGYVGIFYDCVARYEGIDCGTSNKITGTKDFYVHVRLSVGNGVKNWPSVKRDLRNEIEAGLIQFRI